MWQVFSSSASEIHSDYKTTDCKQFLHNSLNGRKFYSFRDLPAKEILLFFLDAGNVSSGECHRFYIFLLDTGDHDVLKRSAEQTIKMLLVLSQYGNLPVVALF